MQVTSATSPLSTMQAAGSSTTSAGLPAQTLGINDFMQLLATQFEEQDPLQPMDDTAFIAQTAQFTALQQTTTLTQNMSQLAASSYIGQQVSINSPTGQTVNGTVTGVDTSGATPNLIIGGAEYPMANLLSINGTAAAASSTSSTTPSTSTASTPSTSSTTTPATTTASASGS